MLKEKIYKDIDAHRVIIEGVFETSEYLKPLDIIYSFDTKKRDQLIDKYKALPNIIYIATRQVNKMTTSFNREEIKQMLDDLGIDYSLNSDTPGIVYKDGTYQTFDQTLESFRQQFIYPERNDT